MRGLLTLSILPLLLLQASLARPRSKEVRTLNQGKSSIIFSRFTGTTNELVAASSDANIALWNIRTGKRLWQMSLKKRGSAEFTIPSIINVWLSLDGQTLGISYWQSRIVDNRLMKGRENHIALLDVKSGRLKTDFVTDQALEHAIGFSPTGRLAASATDKLVRLWDTQTTKENLSIETKERPILIVFSPNEKVVAIATEPPSWLTPPDPMIGIYDAQSGVLLKTIPRRRRNVSILQFSPDSQSLAIVTDDARGAVVDLWDLEAKEPKRTLNDHEAGITAIAFSRDGRLLASGDLHNGRGTVIIREVSTNAQPRMQKLAAGVDDLSFSPDSSLLAVGTESGQIVLIVP